MQFGTLFAPARSRPVSAGLIGCGEFGQSLIAQSRRMDGLAIRAALDRDPRQVAAALREEGVPARICEDGGAAEAAYAAGEIAICASVELLLALPIEIVVEATGDPEAGARHAEAAIAAGRGVAMVSKEAECVVGPILARKAKARGVAYTLVDGDQPSLLIGLVSWARVLGLPIVAAGKSSEYDYLYEGASRTLTWTDRRTDAPGLADLWRLSDGEVATVVAGRAEQAGTIPLRTVPDYCEMCLVANATGLKPDRPDFHAPLTRTTELPTVYCPIEDGGVLTRRGVLDVFNCLREPADVSFAGGVFVVVELADERTGALFAGKGIPVSRDRRYGLVYNPSHLLGVEAPISIMAAARLGHDMLDESYRPVCDLVARAGRLLPAGHQLDMIGLRHAVPDLEPLLLDAAPASGGALPYYMAVGRTLARTVAKGEFISADAVEPPTEPSALWRLRAEQDALFFPA